MDDRRKIDRGTMMIVVFLICAVTLGYLMVGGTIPIKLPKYNYNLTSVEPKYDIKTDDTLQLRTFGGATITPYPTLPGRPLPPATPLNIVDCGYVPAGNFNQGLIWAINMNSSPASSNELALKLFYSGKNALTLGAGNTSPMSAQPAAHISKPNVGDITQKDVDKLPFAPALFLTNTTQAPNAKIGDGEGGGVPLWPSDIYGSWKSRGGQNPQEPNVLNFAGGDPWPATNVAGPHFASYTAQVIWKLSDLLFNGQPLIPGNSYRAEFVVHDNEDMSQICLNFQVPGAAPAPNTQIAVLPIKFDFFPNNPGGTTPQDISITNNSTEAITTWTTNVSYSSNGAGWLTLTPANGTQIAPGANALITATINPSGLGQGVYSAAIIIQTNLGNSQTITATVQM